MLKLLLGDPNARKLKRYQPIVSDINLLEEESPLGGDELQRPGLMREAERFFILQQIDTLWRGHLQAMDALREYENEGDDLFLEMMTQMRRNVIDSMFIFQPASVQNQVNLV